MLISFPLGHAGHETVNFLRDCLSTRIRNRLETFLANETGSDSCSSVADVLRQSITDFDNLIVADLLKLFPNPAALDQYSDPEIHTIIHDTERNSDTVYRCMSGSTVLLSLLDPTRRNLWAASLGDSQAGGPCFLHRVFVIHAAQPSSTRQLKAHGKQKC